MGDYTKDLEGRMSGKPGVKNVLERVAELEARAGEVESTIPKIISAINEVVGKLHAELGNVQKTLNAVIEAIGPDVVLAKIAEQKSRELEQVAKSQKEALAQALIDNTVKEVEAVHEKCVLTGLEYDKDGAPVGSGYLQLPFDTFIPDVRDQFLGQTKGFKMTTETGGTFEITGVYEMQDKPADEVSQADLSSALAQVEQDVVDSTQP